MSARGRCSRARKLHVCSACLARQLSTASGWQGERASFGRTVRKEQYTGTCTAFVSSICSLRSRPSLQSDQCVEPAIVPLHIMLFNRNECCNPINMQNSSHSRKRSEQEQQIVQNRLGGAACHTTLPRLEQTKQDGLTCRAIEIRHQTLAELYSAT